MGTSEQILGFIKQNGKSTPKQLTDALGVSKRTVMSYLSELLAQGKIDKIGNPPKVHYFLKEFQGASMAPAPPLAEPATATQSKASKANTPPETASQGNGTINRFETTTSVNTKLEELTAIMVDVCTEIVNLGKEIEKIHSLLQPAVQPAQAPTVSSQAAPPPKAPATAVQPPAQVEPAKVSATPVPPFPKITLFMMFLGFLIIVGLMVFLGYLIYLIFHWLVVAVITIYSFIVHLWGF